MTRRAVVLFARTPAAEAAAKGLPRSAAVLFEALIRAWLRAAESAGAAPIIACAPADRRRLVTIASAAAFVDQQGTTFGQRLANTAIACARFSPVIIAGIDSPPPDLLPAFERLERGDVDGAIAPARDGGINAIGFVKAPVALLQSFRVGDRSLAARCLSSFERVCVLEPSSDFDGVTRGRAARREHLWIRFRELLPPAPYETERRVLFLRTRTFVAGLRAPPR